MAQDFDDPLEEERAFPRYYNERGELVVPSPLARVSVRLPSPLARDGSSEESSPADARLVMPAELRQETVAAPAAQQAAATGATAAAPGAAAPVIVRHVWQETHANAPTSVYSGPTADDRRVAENPDAGGALQSKARLHLCFVERAIATVELDVPASVTVWARWEILDAAGAVVRAHPSYTQANFDASANAARMADGRHGFVWDGRNAAAQPVFVGAGTYTSRVTIKDQTGATQESRATIEVEGPTPYRVFVEGRPKRDAELLQAFNAAGFTDRPRFLNASGERIGRDCWLLVHRGAQDDGHVVFLGQTAIEATKAETGNRDGAIATPHGREYKGFIRKDPHAQVNNYDRIQIQDLGATNGQIALDNPGGPAPQNPYASPSNSEYKDGVQTHAGNVWTTDGLSIGCTTACSLTGTLAAPSTALGALRSVSSSFGGWGTSTAEDAAVRGPAFANKQSKRTLVADAHRTDDHASPLLDPPAPSGTGLDEPLHMQPTFQQATFGGLLGHEIPRSFGVADEPTNAARIRVELGDYDATNQQLYYLYHHAVVFGHVAEAIANGRRFTVWFPRKVIRGWNGNFRNLLVRGRCQIAWWIEPEVPAAFVGPIQEVAVLFPAGQPVGTWAALPNNFIGRRRQDWTSTQPIAPGRYVSVLRYQLELRPSAAADHAWVPEPAIRDIFPAEGSAAVANPGAQLAAEQIVTIGPQRFLEGESRLVVTV
jgi:hypothetical protein